MSSHFLPWRASHSFILRSALARSPSDARLSMNSAKIFAKRCAGVLFTTLPPGGGS